MNINAFAALKPKNLLEKFTYEPKPLNDWDVEIEISHCGICHSDIHLIDNDWSISKFPLVPGHEIVGKVTTKGKSVPHLKVGDRVGVGWQRASCQGCNECKTSNENYCANSEATCVGNYGGFATHIRTDSRFAFKIPENLSSEKTAPLLCGGITVFSPLLSFNVRPEHRVGVIGIGGLGHLALQFANKFGCEVTAFSTSAGKEEEVKKMGAHHFIKSDDPKALRKVKGSFDFIISTVFSNLEWSSYLQALRLDGTLCLVGATSTPLSIPATELMSARRRITSSMIGSPADIRTMLEFAGRHQIEAQTEVMRLDQANTAIEKVRENKVRYRMVLETKL